MSGENDPVADAVNAASWAAENEVYEYAHRFKRREDYMPLEELARRVQRAAVAAAVTAVRLFGEQPAAVAAVAPEQPAAVTAVAAAGEQGRRFRPAGQRHHQHDSVHAR